MVSSSFEGAGSNCKLTPATEPSWTIVPFALISKGRKVWHIVITAKRLVSKV